MLQKRDLARIYDEYVRMEISLIKKRKLRLSEQWMDDEFNPICGEIDYFWIVLAIWEMSTFYMQNSQDQKGAKGDEWRVNRLRNFEFATGKTTVLWTAALNHEHCPLKVALSFSEHLKVQFILGNWWHKACSSLYSSLKRARYHQLQDYTFNLFALIDMDVQSSSNILCIVLIWEWNGRGKKSFITRILTPLLHQISLHLYSCRFNLLFSWTFSL